MGLKLFIEIGTILVGLMCLAEASAGEPIPFKGAYLSPWAAAGAGLTLIVLSVISMRSISADKKSEQQTTDEELAEDLARQEQLYFEEHGETPAETTARLAKEKRERKEQKTKKG